MPCTDPSPKSQVEGWGGWNGGGMPILELTTIGRRSGEPRVAMLTSLDEGDITPVIAERIPLAEASRAHTQLERGGRSGKHVLVTDAYTGPT